MSERIVGMIFVVGETASGKSDHAVRLALERDGEVVSADSRQVYRRLDIGTGKITASEMQGVPHHLLDVADPDEVFTLADYLPLAEAAIDDIAARGKIPIICGGTGLYIDGLLAGYQLADQVQPTDRQADIAQLQAQIDSDVLVGLTDEEANNHQHLAALIARGGVNLPPRWPDRDRPGSEVHYCYWPPDQLRERIGQRIESRMQDGMLDEVKQLIDDGVSAKWLKSLGLEYRYLTMHLEGELELDEAIEQLELGIWKFTRKQRNWLKRWPIEFRTAQGK